MQHVTHESKSIFIIKLHLPKLLSNVKGYTFLRLSVQRQKTVVFAAEYQLKRVTVAILNCASFHSLCCVMNRKGKYFKQCFYRNNKMFCGTGIKGYSMCSSACLSALTQVHNRFASRLLPCRWYDVRNEPRNPLFTCVKSLLLLRKPHSWF